MRPTAKLPPAPTWLALILIATAFGFAWNGNTLLSLAALAATGCAWTRRPTQHRSAVAIAVLAFSLSGAMVAYGMGKALALRDNAAATQQVLISEALGLPRALDPTLLKISVMHIAAIRGIQRWAGAASGEWKAESHLAAEVAIDAAQKHHRHTLAAGQQQFGRAGLSRRQQSRAAERRVEQFCRR